MPSRTFYRRHLIHQLGAVGKELDALLKSVNQMKSDIKSDTLEGNDLYIYREILYPLEKELNLLMDSFEYGEDTPKKELTDEEEAAVMQEYEENLHTRFPSGELTDKEVRYIREHYENKYPQLFAGNEFTKEELEGIKNQYRKLFNDMPTGTPKREILREILYPILIKRKEIWEQEMNF